MQIYKRSEDAATAESACMVFLSEWSVERVPESASCSSRLKHASNSGR